MTRLINRYADVKSGAVKIGGALSGGERQRIKKNG
ncbi:hypothetical protein [Dulcicalothrix desertica]|nr:hypothetical protein [Dulcicalothrix desertica]